MHSQLCPPVTLLLAIVRVCSAGGHRRLFVTGTPGIGKTVWQFPLMQQLAEMGATVAVDFEG